MSTIVHMATHAGVMNIDGETADRWIRETVPGARALVNWSEPIVDERTTVRGVPVAEERGLYGSFMLTWFKDRTCEPIIYYLKEQGTYLELAAACMSSALAEEGLVRQALSDGSRMRIAITNDVLQVMAPTPSGRYSMVRHHALMFLAATLWLPDHQRDKWLQLYRLSLEAVRRELALAADLTLFLSEIEDSAFSVFERGAPRPEGNPIASVKEIQNDDRDAITRYMLYCNAAVAILAERLRGARDRGWSEQAWLAREVVRYRSDYYLLEEIDDMRGGPTCARR
jgi:hypothetical protein